MITSSLSCVKNMRSVINSSVFRRAISTNVSSFPALCSSASPPPPPPSADGLGIPVGRRHSSDGRRGLVIWGAIGLGIGSAIGGGYAYNKLKKARTAIANTTEETPLILSSVPAHTPSRSMAFPTDHSGLKLTLFQYQTCPFCCKVRALLDFCGISYDIVEVNPVLRSQIKWSQTYKKVPILVVQTPQGEVLQLNDSSMIVSALYSYLLHNNKQTNISPPDTESDSKNSLYSIAKCYPTVKFNDDEGRAQAEIMNKYFLMLDTDSSERTKEEIIEERLWRRWADSVFVHTLSPNIYRTLPEAIESFKNFDKVGEWEKNFPTWERYLVIYVGALAMWIIGKRLQKRHHLNNDVRQSLFKESDHWIKNIEKKGGEFMGGAKPDLSDLAVYGVLNSIQGCTAFDDLMKYSTPMKNWYQRMQGHLKLNQQEVQAC